MQVRENPSATATVLSMTNGSGITLGGTAGTIAVAVSASTMGSATPGNYVYDLELNSGGQVTRLIQGSFAIEAEVTK
jgi:Ethanolamine utilization protein EutJ (predicted chaperonin)